MLPKSCDSTEVQDRPAMEGQLYGADELKAVLHTSTKTPVSQALKSRVSGFGTASREVKFRLLMKFPPK